MRCVKRASAPRCATGDVRLRCRPHLSDRPGCPRRAPFPRPCGAAAARSRTSASPLRFFISVRDGTEEEIEVDTPKSRSLMVEYLSKLVNNRKVELQPEAGTDDIVIDIDFD